MKLKKIQIQNFRLLKNLELDIEDDLSLIVGKNNVGKTSVLSIMDKFLNGFEKRRIYYDDLNIDFQKELINSIKNPIPDDYRNIGVKLYLFIKCEEGDDLSNISTFFMDLDPDNNYVILGFEYLLTKERLEFLKNDYFIFKQKEEERYNKEKEKYKDDESNIFPIREIDCFLRNKMKNYFLPIYKTYDSSLDELGNIKINEFSYKELDNKEKRVIDDLINFRFISARRDVTNRDIDKTLSVQTSRIYEKLEQNEDQLNKIDEFKDALGKTDITLSSVYKDIFSNTITLVQKFGGIKENESCISINSTLEHKELLKDNTTVMYDHEGVQLPEHFNGLGYMNLISMIFEIEILMLDFLKKKEEKPADINLLFIEEPEAHTHPQMQYIFIQNIQDIIKDNIKKLRFRHSGTSLQYIISTHSSHIVSKSIFNNIKYFRKGENHVISKNLGDLEIEYRKEGATGEEHFRFLKQYLTLNRAELFFADKTIFIEGDTERVLLPAMMRKIDLEQEKYDKDNKIQPLLSQNISIVEVGNYSHIFEKFIDFIGIKTLVITDIDSVKKKVVLKDDGSPKLNKNGIQKETYQSCRVKDGEKTTNSSLNYFLQGIPFKDLIALPKENRCFKKEIYWRADIDGYLQINFQTEQNTYHARSFEDSFFSFNKNIDFIKSNRSKFKGLKNMSFFMTRLKMHMI
ncbi:ATP-dependent endonuclease [Dysgonomonas capnocytophagoides]|uniref:ATP-dependent endonuclease n=1 Tax=Dysgonomonas capnocytophagoides TaxID=45254 RepID=UPI001C87C74B|nr:ATP-dependent endonuclease [Dysgonomonas capnocytophagoides]